MRLMIEFGYNELVGPELTDTRWHRLEKIVVECAGDEASLKAVQEFTERSKEIIAAEYLGGTGEEIEEDNIEVAMYDLDKVIEEWKTCGDELKKKLDWYAAQQEDKE